MSRAIGTQQVGIAKALSADAEGRIPFRVGVEPVVRAVVMPAGPPGLPGPAASSFGWARWEDAVRTQVAPLSLASGVRTQYVMPSFGPLTENHLRVPFDAQPLYDGTKFIGRAVLDTYIIRMRFFGVSSVMNNTLEIDLDIRNQPRTYMTKRVPFHPSAGVTLPLEETFVSHVGGFFSTNGASVYLTADNAAQIYGIMFSVTPVSAA